jgi:hypothetical protein
VPATDTVEELHDANQDGRQRACAARGAGPKERDGRWAMSWWAVSVLRRALRNALQAVGSSVPLTMPLRPAARSVPAASGSAPARVQVLAARERPVWQRIGCCSFMFQPPTVLRFMLINSPVSNIDSHFAGRCLDASSSDALNLSTESPLAAQHPELAGRCAGKACVVDTAATATSSLVRIPYCRAKDCM